MSADPGKKLTGTSSLLSKWTVDVGSSKLTGGSSSFLTSSSLSGGSVLDPLGRKRKVDVLATNTKDLMKKPKAAAPRKDVLKEEKSTENVLMKSSIGTSSSLLRTDLGGSLGLSGRLGSGLQSTLLKPSTHGALGESSALKSSFLSTKSALGATSLTLSGAVTGSPGSLLMSSSMLTGKSLTGGLTGSALTGSSALTSHLAGSHMGEKKTEVVAGKVKSDKKKKSAVVKVTGAYKMYAIPPPQYDLRGDIPDTAEIEMVEFVPPEQDAKLTLSLMPIHDVNGYKMAFINAVSGSLICQPNFKNAKDRTRVNLSIMAEKVIFYDPEFVLKVALYTRKQLNIRTTANFLLALAANIHPCRPFLKKYFSASIALPSDWIEVAEIYQAFFDKSINFGSLPAALRKAMAAKFPDFDKYQLAKYNKEGSRKKKRKKEKKEGESTDTAGARGRGRGRGASVARGRGGRGRGRGAGRGGRQNLLDSDSSSDSDSDEENELLRRQISDVVYDEREEDEEKLKQLKFTLKQLIRKLHITEPVDNVMSLIGKKYPTTLDEFYRCRLPGTWEEEKAGKRMKLPVPETWETQVSLKGNKASTWEELLDHKKLPFMAMLRNLRNLIKAGISNKHHNWVLKKLTDERSVIYSKQFPFRFFSAYEVLGNLEKDFEMSQQAIIQDAEQKAYGGGRTEAPARGRGRGRGRGGQDGTKWWLDKRNKKKEEQSKPKETPFDTQIINRYRKALDTAVKIATTYNVQPIKGRTIIFCDIGPQMKVPCTAARGLGKPRLMSEVAVLLGLMCKYSCEDCEMVVFDENTHHSVELEKGTILDNMAKVLETDLLSIRKHEELVEGLPYEVLEESLRDRIQVDNLIFLSGGSNVEGQKVLLSSFLKKYRFLVNPNLLYVNISFAGQGCGFSEKIKPEHDNDIYISGYSDQILRFIAERGDGGQLIHVEKIDEEFSLKPLPALALERAGKKTIDSAPSAGLPVLCPVPRWRTARIFISSTFRDMHGERDLLTRFVFPELRALGKKHFINVYEVDLRWGVTEEQSRSNQTLELCLTEISKCQFFLGMLGERYGWIPDKYIVPDSPEFDWVRDYPKGASVTELEMYYAALSHPREEKEKAFFYLRSPRFLSDVPKEFQRDFAAEDDATNEKMEKLKSRIRTSGLEVYDGYPCRWGGVVEHKPVVGGLEQFGARVVNNLWNAIQKFYPDEKKTLDEETHIAKLHEAFLESRKAEFVGRKNLKKECMKLLQQTPSGIIMVAGKSGTGKTSLMSSLVHTYVESKFCDSGATVLTHIVGAAPGSTNILATLRRLCYELRRRFRIQTEIPEDFKNIAPKFSDLLTEAATLCGSPLVLFIDGIDMMDSTNLPFNMEWLPDPIPENVIFVISAVEGGRSHSALLRHKAKEVSVSGLDMFDKADVVRNSLAAHRKALDESPFNNQLKLLMAKKEASNPLFLKLACEELRVYGLFEKITSKLKSLSHTIPTLLQEVLTRLESDIGKNIVSTALSLLVCARDGLEAEELHDMLSLQSILEGRRTEVKDIMNIKLTPDRYVPHAVFAHLKRSLQSFLNPTESWSSRLSLAHADITLSIKQRYLKGLSSDEEQALHKLMAGYFYQLADVNRNGTWQSNNHRAFRELPYHLSCSGSFDVLEGVLCNLRFVYHKCYLGLAPQLLEDYQFRDLGNKSFEREQNKCLSLPCVQQYKSFVSRNLHILTSHPALTWQQAINEPDCVAPAVDVRGLLASGELDPRELRYMEWNSKSTEIDPCYLTISSLPQPVTCVAISKDNLTFACGGLDCLVRLYELSTGKELKTFRGHADAISGVCFVGTDKLCSASLDNRLSLWHVADGHRIHVLKGHNRRVNSCASDSAGKLVASASWDCTVKVWKTVNAEQVCDLKVGSPVNCVAFHPEGQLIVTGCWDTTIKIWDTFHKTRKAVLRGHSTSVRDVAYSPSGRHIASAALDGEVKLWAAHNGTQVGNIEGHALPINKLIFSPTGKELITVSDDHKVKVWSGHLGKPVLCVGDEKYGAAMSVALSPDGENVAVGYHGGQTRVFDVLSGMLLLEKTHHSASVRCLRYTRNSAAIVSGSDDCSVKVIDGTSGVELSTLSGHTGPILCVEVVKSYIATSSEDFTCCIFSNSPSWNVKKKGAARPMAVLTGHVGPVTSCTFNEDASKIATASRDMSVKIWDVSMNLMDSTIDPVQTLHACHSDWITDCKWSNLGDFLVTASNDFNLKVWDLKTGSEKFKLSGHMSSINSIAYSYGCVVTCCTDGSVKVWSHKGTEITTLYGHSQRVNGCDMMVKVTETVEKEDPDTIMDWAAAVEAYESKPKKEPKKPSFKVKDVLVATSGDDGTVRLWRPLQANELASLTGHSDRVVAVASDVKGQLCTSSLDKTVKVWTPHLSTDIVAPGHNAPVTFVECWPNGRMFLTGSRDGVMKVWAKETTDVRARCILSLQAHEKSVNCACFLKRDGSLVATGSDDATITVWRVAFMQSGSGSGQSGVFFRRWLKYKTESPVMSLVWNSRVAAKSGYLFLSGEWNGSIKAWNTDKTNQSLAEYNRHAPGKPSGTSKEGHQDWILRLRFSDSDAMQLLTTCADGTVGMWDISKLYKENIRGSDTGTFHYIESTEVDKDIPEHKRSPNWILDIVGGHLDPVVVDSKGQITLSGHPLKIHAGPVSSVMMIGNLIITGSHDQTIKVWNKSLKQVGQFFCPSPVMCLSTPERPAGPGSREISVVCGDQLGNIHFLTWKQ